MGQQQLLLLTLGIVIVGLSVVVGISSFDENRAKAKADAHTADAVDVASKIITWHLTPAMMGGNDDADLSDVSAAALGYDELPSGNSRVSPFRRGDKRIQINRGSASRPIVQVYDVPVTEGSVLVDVAVWGPDEGCLAHRVRYRRGSSWTQTAGSIARPSSGCSWS